MRDYIPWRKQRKPPIAEPGAAMLRRRDGSPFCLLSSCSKEGSLWAALEFSPFVRAASNARSVADQARIEPNCSDLARVKTARRGERKP